MKKKFRDFLDFWINGRTKKAFAGFIFLSTLFIISFFNFSLSIDLVVVLIFEAVILLAFSSEENFNDIVNSIIFGLIILLLLLILVCWIFQIKLSFIPLEMNDNTVLVMFTVVLTIATVLNYSNHKKSSGLSRLTNLSVDLDNSLILKIANRGAFDARGINFELEMNQKERAKSLKKRFLKNLREVFGVWEDRVHILGVKRRVHFDLKETVLKRFDIKEGIESKPGKVVYDIGGKDSMEFFMNVNLRYHSDTYFKSPLPITSRFLVKINKNGRIFTEEVAPTLKSQ